jgi:hypothetical protein
MDSPLRFYFLIVLLVFICACGKSKKPEKVLPAYYVWKLNELTQSERKFLKQTNIRKLYVHVLDVDWNYLHGAVPVAQGDAQSIYYPLKSYDTFTTEVIPVVFLTNKTFEQISTNDIAALAKRCVRRCIPAYDSVDVAFEENHYPIFYSRPSRDIFKPGEVQFDCDWTSKTKEKYFTFLSEVKKLLPPGIKTSATIRLHQYKYSEKTGVPPTDRGMLMVYNVSNPRKYSPDNSILDIQKAQPYFTDVESYPLPLDIALPAWSWCIIYRNKSFYQIENGLTEKELKTLNFLQASGNHMYKVTKDAVFRGLFFRPGDEIKAEAISEDLLRNAGQLSKQAVGGDTITVSLFELSQNEISNYSHETIRQVFASFH